MSEQSKEYLEGYSYALENITDKKQYNAHSLKNPYKQAAIKYRYNDPARQPYQDWSQGLSKGYWDLQQWGSIGDPLEDLREPEWNAEDDEDNEEPVWYDDIDED